MYAIELSYTMQICGIVSLLASSTVLLTYGVFPDLRRLRYIEFVFYIAVNDFLSSLGASFGYSADGSVQCWIQAITTNMNVLSAAFWTTIISYQLFLITYFATVIKNTVLIHLVCWLLPLLITLLPLTTNNSYGNPDDEYEWCFFSSTSTSPTWGLFFWDLMGFYAWLWLAIIINLIFLFAVFFKLREVKLTVMYSSIQYSLNKLTMYPLILILCWAMTTVCDVIDSIHPGVIYGGKPGLSVLTYALPCLQGLCLSISFFACNAIVRQKWLKLFIQCFPRSLHSLSSSESAWLTHFSLEGEIDYIADANDDTSLNKSFWINNNSETSFSQFSRSTTMTGLFDRSSFNTDTDI